MSIFRIQPIFQKVSVWILITLCLFVFAPLAYAENYNLGSYGAGNYNEGDATAPSISLTALSPDPTSTTTPALTGTAIDATASVSAVQYQMDSTAGSWAACTANDGTFNGASEAFTCTVSPALSDGSHTMYVRATDSNANTTGSGSYSSDTFTIDATAPSTPGSPTTISATSSATQSWTWTAATDATSGIASYAYRVLDNLSNLITSGTNTTRTVITNLTQGIYTFFVKSTDNAGNQSAETSGSVTVDTTAPTVPGTPTTTSPTTSTTPTWTWTASTDSGGSDLANPAYSVQWCANSGFSGCSSNTATTNTNSYTHSVALAEGTWYFRVLATDAANNASSYSSAGSVVIDTTVPTTTDSGTDTSWHSTAVTVTLTCSDGSGSGCAHTYYTTDGSTPSISSSQGTSIVLSTDGTYTIKYFSIDAAGNQESVKTASNQVKIDTGAPAISSVSASVADTSATITWTTDEQSSSKINYGLTNSYGSTTSETDTSPRVTGHSVTLTGLTGCTTYDYRVRSRDAATNEQVSSGSSFTTTGCAGSATVDAQSQSTITTSAGGTVNLLSSSKGIALDVPASFAGADATFQIKQLDTSAALTETSQPTGRTLVASYLYDLKALSDVSTKITSFNTPLTVTMTYGAADVVGIDESTLKIYRWDGSSWHQLSSCVVDTGAKTVTCTTTAFSVFGLFSSGTTPSPTPTLSPTPTPSASPSSSGNSGSSNDQSTGPAICSEQRPGSAPTLYQIDREGKSASLYITPPGNPYSRFIISYGTNGSTEQYSSTFEYRDSKSALKYKINDLDPKMTYSFKVQAANGCRPGDWSNTLVIGPLKGKKQSFYRFDVTQFYLKTNATFYNPLSRKPQVTKGKNETKKSEEVQATISPKVIQPTASPVSEQGQIPAPQQQPKRSWWQRLWPF